MNALDELIPRSINIGGGTQILYATVDAIDPLTITVDGDDDPLEIVPSSTVNGIVVGDKVICTLQNNELVVTGIIDGDINYIEEFIDGIATAQSAAENASLTAGEASAKATEALASADGKNVVYHQNEKPAGGDYRAGDIWFDTDDGNKIYIHNGTDFIAAVLQDSAVANLDASSITAGRLTGIEIEGVTITGSTIKTKTSPSGARLQMNDDGISRIDGTGTETMSVTPEEFKLVDPALNTTARFDGSGVRVETNEMIPRTVSLSIVPTVTVPYASLAIDNGDDSTAEVRLEGGKVFIKASPVGLDFGRVDIDGEPRNARLTRSTKGPSMSAGTWTKITFTDDAYNDYSDGRGSFANPATGIITIPTPGLWRLVLSAPWEYYGNPYDRILAISKGTGSPGTVGSYAAARSTQAGRWWAECTYEGFLGAGTAITAWCYTAATSSGGPDPTTSASPPTAFTATKLR